MGFWSTLLSIGGDIAGSFVGDPMLGNQIAGAANAVGGALNSKDAAKAATNTLTGAANQASAQLAPFAQGGNEAFKKQLAMYGITLPTGPQTAAPVAPIATNPPQMTPRYGIDTTPADTPSNNMPNPGGYRLADLVPPQVTSTSSSFRGNQ
jgi:hypothetical protein